MGGNSLLYYAEKQFDSLLHNAGKKLKLIPQKGPYCIKEQTVFTPAP
jgi:hypothetical protein